MLASGGGSENLWNQAKRTALFIELSCALRTEELLFSRAMPVLIEAHQQRLLAESSDSTFCLEWNDACLFV